MMFWSLEQIVINLTKSQHSNFQLKIYLGVVSYFHSIQNLRGPISVYLRPMNV